MCCLELHGWEGWALYWNVCDHMTFISDLANGVWSWCDLCCATVTVLGECGGCGLKLLPSQAGGRLLHL